MSGCGWFIRGNALNPDQPDQAMCCKIPEWFYIHRGSPLTHTHTHTTCLPNTPSKAATAQPLQPYDLDYVRIFDILLVKNEISLGKLHSHLNWLCCSQTPGQRAQPLLQASIRCLPDGFSSAGRGSKWQNGNEDFALPCHFKMLDFIPLILGSGSIRCHWFHEAGRKLAGLVISTSRCRHLVSISPLNRVSTI